VQPICALTPTTPSPFQSSPVPKDGCNVMASMPVSRSTCFNPHPSRRTGATDPEMADLGAESVSILTRPEGRVQRGKMRILNFTQHVSILTRPEGRVQRGVHI